MNQIKRDRFYKVSEARMNKIVSMIRLLGNCSKKASYEYNRAQAERIFRILQAELDKVKAKFENGGDEFSFDNILPDCSYVDLPLPNGMCFRAIAIDDNDFPAIAIELIGRKSDPEKICFAEFNPEHDTPQEIHIGVYNSEVDDTVYYEPYVPKEVKDEDKS